MSASDVAGQFRPSKGPHRPSRRRGLWSIFTWVLAGAVFAQAVFAGAMLSGVEWARPAHNFNAVLVMAASLVAGLVAALMLRRVPNGLRFATLLLSLAAVVLLQTVLGKWSAGGANLMWLHVPLGVALVGLTMQLAMRARRLG